MRKDLRLWYGWVILFTVFTILMFTIGIRNSIGVFFKEVSGEFGWNRAQTAAAFTMGMLGQAVVAPLAGWVLERFNMRWVIGAGIFVNGAALIIGTYIGALWHYYAMYFLLSVGFAFTANLPQVQLLANWFVVKRGLAMGFSHAAQGFAPILNIFTPLLIVALGWRMSYLALAGVTLLIVLPFALVLLRDHPREKRTAPDAPFLTSEEFYRARARAAVIIPPNREKNKGSFSFLFTRRFMFIGGIFGSVAYIFTAFIVHFVPHATDQGFSMAGGAALFALYGATLSVGNGMSAISDKIGRTPTFMLGAAFGVAACYLLATFTSETPEWRIYAGAIGIGLALGFVRPTASSLLADHFAGPGFGLANGCAVMVFSLVGALGPLVTGMLFDANGNYYAGFLLVGGMFASGAVFVLGLSRMPLEERG